MGLAPPLDMEQGSGSKTLCLSSATYAVQLLGWLAGYPPGLSVFNGVSWGLVSCKRQRSTKSNDSWCLGSSLYILFIYLYTCHCFTILSLFMHMQLYPKREPSSELQFSLQSSFRSASISSTRYSSSEAIYTCPYYFSLRVHDQAIHLANCIHQRHILILLASVPYRMPPSGNLINLLSSFSVQISTCLSFINSFPHLPRPARLFPHTTETCPTNSSKYVQGKRNDSASRGMSGRPT